jgi:release factor glutamine methyltransferase
MLAMARSFLERKGLDEARLEAELLVAHALQRDRLGLFLQLDAPVQSPEIDRARDLLVRRGRNEPVAYITGEREFYGRPFHVGRGVLIPRPETELIVDRAREALSPAEEGEALRPPEAGVRVLDLGTGSGCLAITLALELPGAAVTAVEISASALEFARTNAAALEAEVQFIEGDGIAAAKSAGPFELVVSNPPYVTTDSPELADEVREFEPAEALFAPDGDADFWVRALLDSASDLIAPGGLLFIELGFDQSERVRTLCAERGVDATVHADLAGTDRVLEVRY